MAQELLKSFLICLHLEAVQELSWSMKQFPFAFDTFPPSACMLASSEYSWFHNGQFLELSFLTDCLQVYIKSQS